MLRASRSRMRAHGSRGASVTPYLGDSGGAVVELEATADCASLMWEDAIWMEPSDACGSVRALRQRGFGGVLVIQSANDELEDEEAYKAAGADGSIGKAVRGGVPVMLGVLGRLYHARFGGAQPAVRAAAVQLCASLGIPSIPSSPHTSRQCTCRSGRTRTHDAPSCTMRLPRDAGAKPTRTAHVTAPSITCRRAGTR